MCLLPLCTDTSVILFYRKIVLEKNSLTCVLVLAEYSRILELLDKRSKFNEVCVGKFLCYFQFYYSKSYKNVTISLYGGGQKDTPVLGLPLCIAALSHTLACVHFKPCSTS